MNGSTAIFTTPGASTNSTDLFPWLIRGNVDITVMASNVLFGVPTHSYIIWHIIRVMGSGIASEFFNLNLSICELLYSFNGIFYVLAMFFPSILMLPMFFNGLGINGRPLFYCLICVERYLAVVYPVTFLKYKPLRYRLMCSSVVWIICLSSCFFCAFVLSSASFLKFTWLLSVQFLLLLSIQLFCCLAVLRALKQSGPGEKGREREEENHKKRRAFHLILITTVTTVFLFVPYIITGILTLLQHDVSFWWSVSFFCFILAAFVHPVLYLHRNGKFNCLCSLKKLLFNLK